MESAQQIKKLIEIKHQRLQKLKEREALQGVSVDPSVPIEIENIEVEINKLRLQLAALEGDIPAQDDDPVSTLTSPSVKRSASPLNKIFVQAGVPLDMPLHEKVANLIMISLSELSLASFGVVSHFLALLILGVLLAWWLATSGQFASYHPVQFAAIIWLGLTFLPLLAGFLPQQREKNLGRDFTLRQRLALYSDKLFGIYISAYLGEVMAILMLLTLVYTDIWVKLSVTLRVAFWLIAVILIYILAFVGAVITTKYWENLLLEKRGIDLGKERIFLALGFPVIVYPFVLVFGWLTLPLWLNPLSGCLIFATGLLFLAWQINRQA